MTGIKRAGTGLLVVALAGGAGASLMAQIPGMPLFTNPRYGTGIRVHADAGKAIDDPTDRQVVQGGASLALGAIGLNANVGVARDDFDQLRTGGTQDPATSLIASGLAQLRVLGGGRSNLSLSVFGGASYQINATDLTDLTGVPQAVIDSLGLDKKVTTFPVGAAIGLRIPLGVASLNLWGAPRMTFIQIQGCSGPGCPDPEFRWAVGADFPILRILSIRAAYDSGKIENQTVSYVGVGASIGIGGVR